MEEAFWVKKIVEKLLKIKKVLLLWSLRLATMLTCSKVSQSNNIAAAGEIRTTASAQENSHEEFSHIFQCSNIVFDSMLASNESGRPWSENDDGGGGGWAWKFNIWKFEIWGSHEDIFDFLKSFLAYFRIRCRSRRTSKFLKSSRNAHIFKLLIDKIELRRVNVPKHEFNWKKIIVEIETQTIPITSKQITLNNSERLTTASNFTVCVDSPKREQVGTKNFR